MTTDAHRDYSRPHETVSGRSAIHGTGLHPLRPTSRFRADRENWTECQDCRDVEGNHSRPERAYPTKGTFIPDKCGTTAGYSQHKAYGVPICPPCQEAARTYERERKRAKSKTGRTRLPHPSPCGTPGAYTRHRRLNEPIDDACRKANSAACKDRRDRHKEAAPHEPY